MSLVCGSFSDGGLGMTKSGAAKSARVNSFPRTLTVLMPVPDVAV